jgi:hypothetical protein
MRMTQRQRARLTESLAVDLRKLCDMLIPDARYAEVSEAAAEVTASLEVDLRVQPWQAQAGFDAGRRLLHYEHMTPVGRLVALVRSADTPDEIVSALSDHLRVAWITKEENSRLTALGFRHKRPDPEAAYQAAGIVLLPNLPDPASAAPDEGMQVRAPWGRPTAADALAGDAPESTLASIGGEAMP